MNWSNVVWSSSFLLLFFLGWQHSLVAQAPVLVNNQALSLELPGASDTISLIVVDTALQEKKPVFLFCQGSLPKPLFAKIDGYGTYMFGGGVQNFNYKEISEEYYIVVISMPATPVLVEGENLDPQFNYIPDPSKPGAFSTDFLAADYLDNYVARGLTVLEFLQKQSWVDTSKLVVAGHSQGAKIAGKLAKAFPGITHLGLFSANPFGRVDETIRRARYQAQQGQITWEMADSVMNQTYDFYKSTFSEKAVQENPSLKAWNSFSETFYDDWLGLNILIYLAYGTADRTADLCDLIPLYFTAAGKNNLTLKRYIGLEHNFFEIDQTGQVNYEAPHWPQVMTNFLDWIETSE